MMEVHEDDPLTLLRHDLANLLTMVRGYAELMLMRDTLDPGLRRYPEQIVLAADRATAKLEQLRILTIREQFSGQDMERPQS
jgi:signal transduction histidine kinase